MARAVIAPAAIANPSQIPKGKAIEVVPKKTIDTDGDQFCPMVTSKHNTTIESAIGNFDMTIERGIRYFLNSIAR